MAESKSYAERHASAAETLDTYSHLRPDSEDRTAEAVDAVLLKTPRPHRGPRSSRSTTRAET